MEFEDIIKIELSYCESSKGMAHCHEVTIFTQPVYDYHDHLLALGLRQSFNEVHSHFFPDLTRQALVEVVVNQGKQKCHICIVDM